MNYLLNLGFSAVASNDGNFQADKSNSNPLLRSSVWLSGGSGIVLQDNFYQITLPLSETDWTFAQESTSSLQVEADGEYNIIVRVFQADSPVSTSYKAMLNAVFGQGSDSDPVGSALQSPLLVNGFPRTVVDSLQLAFANVQQQQQYWATPSSDGAWTFCLGTIHGVDNTYDFNVGASVCLNPTTGSPVYQYGTDPVLRVGMGLKHRRRHDAA